MTQIYKLGIRILICIIFFCTILRIELSAIDKSRVIQEAKGGDIDLYLQAVPEGMASIKKKIAFIVDLKKDLGDQKIDVVFKSTDNSTSRFQQIIERTIIPIS